HPAKRCAKDATLNNMESSSLRRDGSYWVGTTPEIYANTARIAALKSDTYFASGIRIGNRLQLARSVVTTLRAQNSRRTLWSQRSDTSRVLLASLARRAGECIPVSLRSARL